MKFAHMGDCHLGGWRQPELKELNFKSFQKAIEICLKEKVDFVLISGDLFDSAYPPIETLKDSFNEFRKLRESNIPVFLIAGSHDYSASGKTFLDVLEKSGFCKNVSVYEEKPGKIILLPTIYKNIAFYGYSGRKSALEVEDIEKISIQDSPGLFKILLLHTAIKDAVQNNFVKSVDEKKLPKVDYLALSHLHINYAKNNRVYSGPIFPNNLSELDELKSGFFYLFDSGIIKKKDIKLKEVISLDFDIKNALNATEQILEKLEQSFLKDKIVILKIHGILEKGKTSDINFKKIEEFIKQSGAFVFLKSTSKLHMSEPEIKLDLLDSIDIEAKIIKGYEDLNPNRFNSFIHSLMNSLQTEKLEDERSAVFEDRIVSESKKVLGL